MREIEAAQAAVIEEAERIVEDAEAKAPTPVELGESLLAEFTEFDRARRKKEAWALDEAAYGRRLGCFTDSYEPPHPTILVVHASVGSGHRSAAIGIAQALVEMRDRQDPAFPDGSPIAPDTQIAVVDILAWGEHRFDGNHTASMFTGFTRPFYDVTWRYTLTGRNVWGGGTGANYVLWRKYTRFIGHIKPLAVIATHIMGAIVSGGARTICHQDFPLVSVPTDYETEGLWPHKDTDCFCVGTEDMAETLRARKISDQRICITGIPTRSDFRQEFDATEVRERMGLPTQGKLVLALAGAHLPQPYVNFRETLEAALPALSGMKGIHMVVICGKDSEYETHMRELCRAYHLSNVTILGYTLEMAALMAASDVIVCKAGGLTVTECLCVGTPMLLVGRAYGQEKVNMRMLTNHGAAMHATTSRELVVALDIIAHKPERTEAMVMNANLLRRPNAAVDVARKTLELTTLGEGEALGRRGKHAWLGTLYRGHGPAHTR